MISESHTPLSHLNFCIIPNTDSTIASINADLLAFINAPKTVMGPLDDKELSSRGPIGSMKGSV